MTDRDVLGSKLSCEVGSTSVAVWKRDIEKIVEMRMNDAWNASVEAEVRRRLEKAILG